MKINTAVASEQAYLVARGVRALALVGSFVVAPDSMRGVRSDLCEFACHGALPFVCDRGDGFADYGFAADEWVIELYGWIVKTSQADNPVPQIHGHRIIGLLLGYSVSAISNFETANLNPSTSGSAA